MSRLITGSQPQYRALKRPKGFVLMPLSKDAYYVAGFFTRESGSPILSLQSDKKYQSLEWYQKFDAYGQPEIGKGPNKGMKAGERRMVEKNYIYELTEEEAKQFITEFVDNADQALEWIDELPAEELPADDDGNTLREAEEDSYHQTEENDVISILREEEVLSEQ